MKKELHIFIIAGELSGDLHASKLLQAFRQKSADIKFSGIGGDRMINSGLNALYHISQMAFLGFGEVLRHLPFIFSVLKKVKYYLRNSRPDLVILVDYPGFNLKIAKYCHEIGIPVVYYISPQLWAWGKNRLKKIRKFIDQLIVVFPFEVDFYKKHGIDAIYLGHPLVDEFSGRVKQKTLVKGQAILGLMPGSRRQELDMLLKDMVDTAAILYENGIIKEAWIAKVDNLSPEIYDSLLENKKYIRISEKKGADFYNNLDVALVKSGTSTLETGYFQVPLVVVYRVSPITWLLGNLLVKLKTIGLVNIVAGRSVAEELLQDAFNPKTASRKLENLLNAENNRKKREELKIIAEKLGSQGASERVADYILNTYKTRNQKNEI